MLVPPRLLSYVTADVLDTAEQLRDMLGEVRERRTNWGPLFMLSVMSNWPEASLLNTFCDQVVFVSHTAQRPSNLVVVVVVVVTIIHAVTAHVTGRSSSVGSGP